MAVLRDTPAAARQLTRDLTSPDLRTPEAEGKWSALQVLQHGSFQRLNRSMASATDAPFGYLREQPLDQV